MYVHHSKGGDTNMNTYAEVKGKHTWAAVDMNGSDVWYIGYGTMDADGNIPYDGGTAERLGHFVDEYPTIKKAMKAFLTRFVKDSDEDEARFLEAGGWDALLQK